MPLNGSATLLQPDTSGIELLPSSRGKLLIENSVMDASRPAPNGTCTGRAAQMSQHQNRRP
jgi:hypothetical protein